MPQVEYGDGTPADVYEVPEAGKIIMQNHKFADEGMYAIGAHCHNEFGDMEHHTTVIVRDVISTFAPSEVIKIMMNEDLKLDIPPQVCLHSSEFVFLHHLLLLYHLSLLIIFFYISFFFVTFLFIFVLFCFF